MTKKAFVVGINTLGLKYCTNDATLMTDCLERHGYDVVTIKTTVEKHDLLAKFEDLIDNCDKTDTLIFYFSGHGVLRKGKLDLLLSNDSATRSSRISINDITDAFEDCIAGQKLLVLDCCHAGATHDEWKPDPSDVYRLLTASERLEKSKELDELAASFLTYHIHQALAIYQVELLTNDSTIRIDALYAWLKEATEKHNGTKDSIKVPIPNLLGNAKVNFEIATLLTNDTKTLNIKPENRREQLLWEKKAEARYRDLALESCDIVDLANLPESDRHLATRHLELRRLYVSLRVRVEISSTMEADDADLDAIEKRREKLLWNRTISDTRKEESERLSIGERLNHALRLVVLGDPGAGKTTMLRWLATAYFLRLKADKDWQALPDVKTLPDENWLPIIIRCRDLDQDCLNGSLDDMLRHTLRKSEMDEAEAQTLRKLLRDKLSLGQALLLIDGLDEITDPALRIRFCQQVEQMQIAYPNTAIIVTSRIVGYREMGYRIKRGFEHVTVAELTKDDKDDFARRWCALTEIPERRTKATNDLIRDIHSSDRIERLTGNPMLLTTMALVKRKVGKLPSRRVELYWEAVQVLLNWRREVDEPIDQYEAIPQLEYIAYTMCNRGVQQLREDEIIEMFSQMRQEYPNIYAVHQHTPEDFLRLIERRTGILIEAGHARHLGHLVPVFEFRHLTFQEYLAGLALVEGRFPGRNKNLNLAAHVAPLAGRTSEIEIGDSKKELAFSENWREALRLCVSACSDDDVDNVLEAILTPLPNEDTAQTTRQRIVLATLCLADEPNVNTVLADIILQKFAMEFNEEDRDRFAFGSPWTAAQEISRTRWAKILRNYLVQRFCQSDAGMSDMIAFVCASLMYIFPSLSLDKFENLDSISDNTIKDWLNQQIEEINSDKITDMLDAIFGIMFVAAQKKIYVPELVSLTQSLLTKDLLSQRAASLGLMIFNDDDLKENVWRPSNDDIDKFVSLIENPALDVWVFACLGSILANEQVFKVFSLLVGRLNDHRAIARQAAAEALGSLGDVLAIEPLIFRLADQDKEVRKESAKALGKLGDLQSVEPLLALLADPEKDVRKVGIEVLGKLGDRRAVKPLINMLADPDVNICRVAVGSLGRLGSKDAVVPLISLLTNPDNQIRKLVIIALGQLNDLSAVDPLIEQLTDSDSNIRSAAVTALGHLKDTKSVEPLIQMLFDQAEDVRKAAMFALGQLGDVRSFEFLLTCFDDNDRNMRNVVTQALKKIGGKQIIELLLPCLVHADSNIRNSAVQMLGQIGKPHRVVEPLLRLLNDEDIRVRRSAVYALGWAGDYSINNQLIAHLNDSDSSMRAAVVTTIGLLGDITHTSLLIKKLEDSAPNVRSAAARALGQIGDSQAVGALLAMLNDTDKHVRDSSVQALGDIGDSRASEALLVILDHQDDWVLDSAARALGRIGESRAIKPLLRMLNHKSDWVRSAAARSLGQIGDFRVTESLIAKLEDEDRWVRNNAAWALGQMGNQETADLLIAKLDGWHNGARSAAASALGLLRDKRAVASLLAKLHDRDKAVRGSSVEALGRIGEHYTVESVAIMLRDRDKEVQRAAALALGRIGNNQAKEILQEHLTNADQQTRRNILGGLAMTCQSEVERKLLSSNFDAEPPFLDPQEVINEERVSDAAEQLSLDKKDVYLYYEALAQRFGLKLTWRFLPSPSQLSTASISGSNKS